MFLLAVTLEEQPDHPGMERVPTSAWESSQPSMAQTGSERSERYLDGKTEAKRGPNKLTRKVAEVAMPSGQTQTRDEVE